MLIASTETKFSSGRVLYRTLSRTAVDSASGAEEGNCAGACFRLKLQNHFHPLEHGDGSFIEIKNKIDLSSFQN